MGGGEHQLRLRMRRIGGAGGQQVLHRLVALAGLQVIAAAGKECDVEGRIERDGRVDFALGFLHAPLVKIEDGEVGVEQRVLRIELDRLLEGLFRFAIGIARTLQQAERIQRA